MKFASYLQEHMLVCDNNFLHQAWCLNVDEFSRHSFFWQRDYECDMYVQDVPWSWYFILLLLACAKFNCVQAILEQYILNRWTKNVGLSGVNIVESSLKLNNKDIVASSVWRRQIVRKFSELILASELNENAREYVE